MAMGREFLPPEQADNWGEFHARLHDAWLAHLERGSTTL
jgi:hypothetical protein